MPSLRVSDVTKRYGALKAVDSLTFEVGSGQIFGFLGGNGAGKTTTLRMLLDIIRPNSGLIEVLGGEPGRGRAAEIGFLPEERGLYRQMTALDTIIYFGRLKGMTTSDARATGRELLDRFGLADEMKSKVEQLSKGMAQKVQLATALVNRPKLLILDEPFSGLDPVNQRLLEAEIHRAAANGAAVVFSTHVMQHAERLCDRLLLLDRGRKKFEGTVEEARRQLPSRLVIVARADLPLVEGIASAHMDCPSDDGWHNWKVDLAPYARAGDVLERFTSQSVPLRRFEERSANLHDVFLHLVGQEEVAA